MSALTPAGSRALQAKQKLQKLKKGIITQVKQSVVPEEPVLS